MGSGINLKAASLMVGLNETAIQVSKKYIFSPSAVQFQHDLMLKNEKKMGTVKKEMLYPETCIWIEAEGETLGPNDQIKAFYMVHVYHPTVLRAAPQHLQDIMNDPEFIEPIREHSEESSWTITLISKENKKLFIFDVTQDGEFALSDTHVCPYGECSSDSKEPCQGCKNYLYFWGVWLVVALMMIKGQFATTPEPADFPEIKQHIRRRMESDNPKKKKYHEEDLSFKIVNFDACLKKTKYEPQEDREERGSWVEQAMEIDPDSVIYVDKSIASFPRQLRSPYFVNKRGQTIDVTGHERRIPMKLKDVITRVVASQYKEKAK